MPPPPPPHAIQFHSIIGSERPTAIEKSTDGVVPYASSHLPGASELIVRSDHGVQKDPEAIREVRRILQEHVGVVSTVPAVVQEDRASQGVAPAVKLETPVQER